MKKQIKWPHLSEGRSEVCVEALKESSSLWRFIPFSKYFRSKTVKPSLYFYTSRLNKIYFSVFPSDISTPNAFRLVIDNIQLPDLPKEAITDGTVNNIEFDENYSYVVAKKPIKFHFPYPGLVIIHYRILGINGTKPLDKNGKEIFLAQRTLSGEIGRGYHDEHYCNVGQIPIIIVDFHSKILIKLTWALIILTAILIFQNVVLMLKG